ncbi:MAG: sigma-70 family RNA polymerase sigma factor [Planctomycetes bacterium]|nr:sigma-70 family RNA polymerase sigma factor [Planctomycetota bacterium]
MTERTDTVELLQQARRGDRLALDELFARYRPQLVARVRLMLGDGARRAAESSDFAQIALLEFLADPPELADAASFLRWVTRTARHRIVDAGRRRREAQLSTLADHVFDGDDPAQMVVRSERVDRLVDALAELPDDLRRVIELRDLEGLSFRAVGDAMERSENAVQLMHTRALIRLGRALRERDADP